MVTNTIKFENDLERLYFQRFLQEVAPTVGESCAGGYWSRALPNACHEEAFALGFILTFSAATLAEEVASKDPVLAAQHSSFAAKRYVQAISDFRKSLAIDATPRKGRSLQRNYLFSLDRTNRFFVAVMLSGPGIYSLEDALRSTFRYAQMSWTAQSNVAVAQKTRSYFLGWLRVQRALGRRF
jgi:hypothetical protein